MSLHRKRSRRLARSFITASAAVLAIGAVALLAFSSTAGLTPSAQSKLDAAAAPGTGRSSAGVTRHASDGKHSSLPRKGGRPSSGAPHPGTSSISSPGGRAAGGSGGPILAGDSKTSCVDLAGTGSALMANLQSAERMAGVTYDCLETFIDADTTWAEWERPWIDGSQYGFTSWIAASPAKRQLVLSMNLIPDSETDINDPLGWEKSCDAGDFNGYAVTLAHNLVSSGFGNSVIRLGKEMNGNWENDFMGTTTQEQQAWAGCFAKEATAMRSVSGAHFLFDWNVNACVENFPLANWYPGNSYVNIIGIDTYDSFCDGKHPAPSAAAFRQLADLPDGLNAVQAFAAEHGKPMSIPEWGAVASSSGGLGDDPFYIDGIGSYVAGHDVAFQCYFDPGDDGILPLTTSNPQALAAYRQEF